MTGGDTYHYTTEDTHNVETNLDHVSLQMLFKYNVKGYRVENLHRPGIEPGPPAWQASILPLNHRCVHVLKLKPTIYRLLYQRTSEPENNESIHCRRTFLSALTELNCSILITFFEGGGLFSILELSRLHHRDTHTTYTDIRGRTSFILRATLITVSILVRRPSTTPSLSAYTKQ